MAREERAADERREAAGFRTDLAVRCIDVRTALDKPGAGRPIPTSQRTQQEPRRHGAVQGSTRLRDALNRLDVETASSWKAISPLMWSLEEAAALKESEIDAQHFDAAADARDRAREITTEIDRA